MKKRINVMMAMLGIGMLVSMMGCAGYRVGNIQGAELKGVKTIYVPVVKNESYEPNLPVLVTNAIIGKIDADGTFTTARSKQADGVLEVTIKDVKRTPLRSFSDNVDRTAEYEIILVAEVTFTNLVTSTKVLNGTTIHGKTSYYLFRNMQESERQAIPLAAQDLAYQIVKRLAEGW